MQKLLTKQFYCVLIVLLANTLLFKPAVQAEPPKSDSEMLSVDLHLQLQDKMDTPTNVSVMQVKRKNVLAKYNPLTLSFSGLMYVYQKHVSPQLPSACLYEHSCSSFSRHLILEYGLTKGIFTTADRLMRCNRIAASDIHPLFIGEQSGRVMETVGTYKMKSE